VQRLKELVERYSPEVVESAIETIYRETEQRCRNVVERIPDGTYEASSVYDDDSVNPDEPIRIHAHCRA
jgi:N-methylhydantoinase B